MIERIRCVQTGRVLLLPPLSKHNRHSREGGNTLQQDHLTSNQERSIGLRMTPACHQNRAVGMTNHRVGDAAHQSPLHPTEPTPAHHYESGSKLFGQRHDLLARTPIPQVFFRDLRPASRIFLACSSRRVRELCLICAYARGSPPPVPATYTRCKSESVPSAIPAAIRDAMRASSEPSVAKRMTVGKGSIVPHSLSVTRIRTFYT
jgi:hypothetical protein